MPFMADVTFVSVNVVPVCPRISVHVEPLFVDICHWNVGSGTPLAPEVNVAVVPAFTVMLTGCCAAPITGREPAACVTLIVRVIAAFPPAAATVTVTVALRSDVVGFAAAVIVKLPLPVPLAGATVSHV